MSWLMIPLVLGFFLGSILIGVQVDVPTEIVSVHPSGTVGTVLVVYHPGQSRFHEDVTNAFIEGLVEADWRCDVTTASREAPVEIGDYDLLVLGAPTYEWRPATPIRRYIERLGDLERIPTVLVLTGAGSTAQAASLFVEYVEGANGAVVEMLEIWQVAPNEELHGISDPIEIARRAGAGINRP